MAQIHFTIEEEILKELFTDVGRYVRHNDRSAYRNGNRQRQLKTRIGSITLNVPKHRNGTFSTKLFTRYERSEQAFFSSAIGEYLDEHGSLRGIKRHKGKKAIGEITFYRDSVSNKKILLPRGIICETSSLLEERFVTSEDKILGIGESSINIAAESMEIGHKKNIPSGKIDIMVSSIFGIKIL